MLNRFTYQNHPNYSVKKPKILYIDRYGQIYPDCKTYITPPICHITDDNSVDKILSSIFSDNEEQIFNMITVEVSSKCNAKCFYCFQEDENRGKCYQFYDELLNLLNRLNTIWTFFSGGEILVQSDAMDFIRKYRTQNPNVWIHLKTNGNATGKAIDFVKECCNSVMVSFNGFSEISYSTIMRLDIKKTIDFCETLINDGTVNVGLKFLLSPAVAVELPSFLNWALALKPKCLALQVAYNYEIEPSGKSKRLENTFENTGSSTYWNSILERTSDNLTAIFRRYENELNCGYNHITVDKELFSIYTIEPEIKKHFRTDGVYIIE